MASADATSHSPPEDAGNDNPPQPSVPSTMELSSKDGENDTQTSKAPSPQPSPPAPRPPGASRHRGLIFFFVLFAYFLFAFDTPVIANIRPNIIRDLGELDKLPILSTVYSLCLTSTNLLWGYLYRNFNYKINFCVAVVLFEIGSAVCGSAPTMDALIAGRAICGMGGGGMYLGTLTYVTISSSPAERPKFLGIVGLTYALGVILGPIISGAFAGSGAGWRWAFYFSLFVGAVAAPVYLFMLPNLDPGGAQPLAKRFQKFDYIGFLLFAGFIATFTLFPSFGGAIWAWDDGRTIALIVVCGVCIIAFSIQQYFCILTTPETRVFPVQLLKRWEYWILFAQMSCAMTATYIPLYFIPLELQFVRGDSALLAGAKVLPFLGTACVMLIISGTMLSRIPVYMPYYLIGGLFVLGGGVALHFDSYSKSDAYLIGVSTLVGMVGLYSQTSFSVAQVKAGAENVGAATALIGLAQVGSIDIALVISNSLFLNQAVDKIASLLPNEPRSNIYNAVGGNGSTLFDELSPQLRVAVLTQVVDAIREAYYLVIVAGALSVLLALCMKRERLGAPPVPPKDKPKRKDEES